MKILKTLNSEDGFILKTPHSSLKFIKTVAIATPMLSSFSLVLELWRHFWLEICNKHNRWKWGPFQLPTYCSYSEGLEVQNKTYIWIKASQIWRTIKITTSKGKDVSLNPFCYTKKWTTEHNWISYQVQAMWESGSREEHWQNLRFWSF